MRTFSWTLESEPEETESLADTRTPTNVTDKVAAGLAFAYSSNSESESDIDMRRAGGGLAKLAQAAADDSECAWDSDSESAGDSSDGGGGQEISDWG